LSTIEIILILYSLWLLLVLLLDKKGLLEKHNITIVWILIIPILMLRTTKGQSFLDWLAKPKRFWRAFANLGLPAMIIGMLAMFLLVIFIDYFLILSFQTATVPLPNKFNEPRNIFLIPGLNEYIPLEWGIIALIVTLVVHEFSHAILCKVEGIKVKSMGLLIALVPIGGFAEPDDEQLLGKKEVSNETTSEEKEPKKLATRRERVRVLTAGVMANFVTAFIAFSLFFLLLGSVSTVGDVMVTSVVSGSPADAAGIKENMVLMQIDNKPITNANDFLSYMKDVKAGTNIVLSMMENGEKNQISLTTIEGNETKAGVKVYRVVPGSPAEAAGIKPGMTMVRIDNTTLNGIVDFMGFMNSTKQGQKVEIYLLSNINEPEIVYTIDLAKYPDSDATKGFLGVSSAPEGAISHSTGIGVGQFPAKDYLNMLKSIPSLLNQPAGWLLLFGLPIFGLAGEGFPGFSGQILNFYEPIGMAAFLGIGTFWILNSLMWIGWMNFYAGLFNCLPAVPLDGGHVFRDVMTSSLSRIFGSSERVEKISNAIVIMFAVLILMSFLFVMLAPYAAHGF
jgi:membrane-associated protease RseP (regulator of RpoE activity)